VISKSYLPRCSHRSNAIGTHVELVVRGRLDGTVFRKVLDDFYSFVELGFRHDGWTVGRGDVRALFRATTCSIGPRLFDPTIYLIWKDWASSLAQCP
jgi:hypothetical protein